MTIDIDASKAKWAEPKLHQNGKYKRYLETDDGVSPLLFPISDEIIKWNSYEHDELGITTENPTLVSKMHAKRNRKVNAFIEYMKKELKTVNVVRGEHPTNIFTYGSTYMSVMEACKYGELNPTIVQPIYLKPLPKWDLEEFINQDNVVVEQSVSGQFTSLLREKADLQIRQTVKQYDGRPFDPIVLSQKLKEVLQ
jgi:2-oxoglutarate ferredoxin oxidoreductase subunit alpha